MLQPEEVAGTLAGPNGKTVTLRYAWFTEPPLEPPL